MATSARTEPARPHAAAAAAQPAAHYLTFALGSEPFAMDIRTVREIIQVGPMTTVPLMPQHVRGVINLRGAVVPVIDPQARFGRPCATLGKKSCIVIFEGRQGADERTELGLLVDAVHAVIDIPAEQIDEPPTFGATVQRSFLRGMARVDARFISILDTDQAFDVDDLAAPGAHAPRMAV